MAILFAIYLLSIFFILRNKKTIAVLLIVINLILSSLMFIENSTDVFSFIPKEEPTIEPQTQSTPE